MIIQQGVWCWWSVKLSLMEQMITMRYVISRFAYSLISSCYQGDQRPMVKMSDGWYSVGVVMDTPLVHLLSTNQIGVGCKLYICGAKFVGPSEPCPPLEVS